MFSSIATAALADHTSFGSSRETAIEIESEAAIGTSPIQSDAQPNSKRAKHAAPRSSYIIIVIQARVKKNSHWELAFLEPPIPFRKISDNRPLIVVQRHREEDDNNWIKHKYTARAVSSPNRLLEKHTRSKDHQSVCVC